MPNRISRLDCWKVAVLLALSCPGLALGAAQGPTVTVVNTTTNPVPVTATVTGTSNVNVTNASIPVSGTVSVSGTVPVTVPGTFLAFRGTVAAGTPQRVDVSQCSKMRIYADGLTSIGDPIWLFVENDEAGATLRLDTLMASGTAVHDVPGRSIILRQNALQSSVAVLCTPT